MGKINNIDDLEKELNRLNPKQEMKKEIYFPKGAQSINVDILNGVITAIYEEEKPALKVGEWCHCPTSGEDALILDEKGHHVGIRNGKWINRDEDVTINIRSSAWKLSDMQEVEKLLIKEAEKRGFKKGVIFNGLVSHSDAIYKGCEMQDDCFNVNSNGIYVLTPEHMWYDLCSNPSIFNAKTGKWAEIVEKKPLKYVIKLTETTKAFPKETFYKCEIGSMLNDTKNKSEAFIFEHFEGAETVKDFIEESYDFKAEIVDYK